MAIKGLSDKLRFERIGKVQIGVYDENSRRPKSVGYFIFTPAIDAIDTKMIADVLGAQPTEIEIAFPYRTIDENAPQYRKMYGKNSKLICKGDGEAATWYGLEERIPADSLPKPAGDRSKSFHIQCKGENCQYSRPYLKDGKQQPPPCSPTMNVFFRIPALEAALGIVGMWQLDTKSGNAIVSLNSAVEAARISAGGENGPESEAYRYIFRMDVVAVKGVSVFNYVRFVFTGKNRDDGMAALAAGDPATAAAVAPLIEEPATAKELKGLYDLWMGLYSAEMKAKLTGERMAAALLGFVNKQCEIKVSGLRELTSTQVVLVKKKIEEKKQK